MTTRTPPTPTQPHALHSEWLSPKNDGPDAVGGRLGERVQFFRRRAGFNQRTAADLAGLSIGGLRDIEQGRVLHPRAATLRKLGNVLGLSRTEFDDLVRQASDEYQPDSGLRVEILGPLRVSVYGTIVDPGSETQSILLGLLAVAPNRPVTRDRLIQALRDAEPAYGTVELLQSRMSRIRRRLAPNPAEADVPHPVLAARSGYQLVVAEDQHDLLVFRRLVARARQARREEDSTEACRLFANAVALWRGTPLEGLAALQAHPMVVTIINEYRAVVLEYAAAAAAVGRYKDVLPRLQRAAEADPLHEAVHAELMIALAGSGQQAAALEVFRTLRRRLVSELGADPGPELAAAHQRVLRQELGGPESVPISAAHQLPTDIADFCGRKAELQRLLDGFTPATIDTAPRIWLIEGMAGVGKTRLALRAAHKLLGDGHCSDCQLYVDLGGHADRPPADPSAVLASFLRLLGVPSGQIPPDLHGRAAQYRDRLYDKNALIVLDNAGTEDQIVPLLPAGPRNVVIVTSRRALAVDGATTLPLQVFSPAEAQELLERMVGVKRVAAEPNNARAVAELCGRHPLALVLTARRLQSRPGCALGDVAARLECSVDRINELATGSRRLRTVFDHSYNALSPDERQLFELLGTCPGDELTADSVALITRHTPMDTRRLLDRLVDENLLTAATLTRYRLHPLLADYARLLIEERRSAVQPPLPRTAAVA